MNTTFIVSYSEGNDALIGVRYVRHFTSWLAAAGTLALTSPVWTVEFVGFSDSSSVALRATGGDTPALAAPATGFATSRGLAEFHREPVRTRMFSGRLQVSTPHERGRLEAFAAVGLAGVWYDPGSLLNVPAPGGGHLSALSLGTRLAPTLAAGLQLNLLPRLRLSIESEAWLPGIRDRVSGDHFTGRNLSVLTSIAAVF